MAQAMDTSVQHRHRSSKRCKSERFGYFAMRCFAAARNNSSRRRMLARLLLVR